MSTVADIADSTFASEVLRADSPVLVHFSATWCRPSLFMAPALEEVAQAYTGRMKVVQMDVGANPETAAAYRLRGIPSLYLFKGGTVVEQIVGAVPKRTLTNVIEKFV
jgi:thioredoxin 1